MPFNDKDFDGVILSMTVDINKKIFTPSEKIELTVSIYNGGDQDLPLTSLTMVLPALVRFLSVNPDLKSHLSGNTVLFELGPVPKKDKRAVTIFCQVAESVTDEIATDIGFTALCDETLVVNDEVNFIIRGKLIFNILQDPALILYVKLDPPILFDSVKASIYVMNQGEKPAENVVLSVTLPTHIPLIPMVGSIRDFCRVGNICQYNLGTIKPKETKEVVLEYSLKDPVKHHTPFSLSCSVAGSETSQVFRLENAIAARLIGSSWNVCLGVDNIQDGVYQFSFVDYQQFEEGSLCTIPVIGAENIDTITIQYQIIDPELQPVTPFPYRIRVVNNVPPYDSDPLPPPIIDITQGSQGDTIFYDMQADQGFQSTPSINLWGCLHIKVIVYNPDESGKHIDVDIDMV
jgi:hypothetical protein